MLAALVLTLGVCLFALSCGRGAVAWKAYADRRAQLVAEGWLR